MDENKKPAWLLFLQILRKGRGWLAILMIILAGFSAYYSWTHPQVQTNTVERWYPVPGLPGAVKEKIVYVDRIITIEKPADLPDDIQADTSKQVLVAGKVPPWEGQTDVTAIIDLLEGRTSLLMKQEALPFFAWKNDAWLIGGLGNRDSGVFEWEYARIEKARLSIYAEINTRPETTVQVRVRIPIW